MREVVSKRIDVYDALTGGGLLGEADARTPSAHPVTDKEAEESSAQLAEKPEDEAAMSTVVSI